MSERQVYLTPEGYEQLQTELHYLKSVRRQQVAERLHHALAEGELIENAELEDARREQAFVEGRIYTLEQQFHNVVIIAQDQTTKDTVTVGCRVTVQEEGAAASEEYFVVGSAEASPREGKISNESPLGRALLGKRVGDKAIVRAPDGDIVFKVITIQ